MKSSLIIILTLLLFTKSQDTIAQKYSIKYFIKYLQDSGIWEVLYEVKKYFGTDIAIEICEDFLQSPYCGEVVRVYIKVPITRAYPEENDLMEFLKKNNYLEILSKDANPNLLLKIKKKLEVVSNQES